jgi:DNA-binding CsgD family transcriptional regulator
MTGLNEKLYVPLSALTDAERLVVGVILEEAKRRAKATGGSWQTASRDFHVLQRPPFRLTGQEVRVVECLFRVDTYKAVAKELGISHRTAESHAGRAREKLGAESKTAMIRMIADLL